MENPTAATDHSLEFQRLMRRTREGDNAARERLYLDYGPHFRRVISKRLKKNRLAWATTPHDIFDSVVLRVWNEDALDSLRTEEEFLKYVSRAVEHEVLDLQRSITARCRDYRREENLLEDESHLVDSNSDPARLASADEEFESVRAQLTEQDRQVLEMWLAGMAWRSISARFGTRVDVIRKRFHRSLEVVRRTLINPQPE